MTSRTLAAAFALLAAAGCSDNQVETTTRNFDRAWDVALVCAVRDDGAETWHGVPISDCGEDGEGSLHAFVIESTPGTLGVVNLRTRRMLDLDPREPLHSSIDVGNLPHGIDAAPDGSLLLVANLGDPPPGEDPETDPGLPYLTAVNPADVLPELQAEPQRIVVPAPAAAVAFVDATAAVVTLPALSSVALVRIAVPPSASVVDVPVPLGLIPDPEGDGGSIEGLPTPWSIALDAGRGRVLVGDRNLGRIAVLVRDGTGALALDRIIAVAGPPIAMAVEPPGWGPEGNEPGRWIYAVNGGTGGVMVLDADTFEPVDLVAGDPMEWRSEISVFGMVEDVVIGRIVQYDPPTTPSPTVLEGTFAFLVTSRGNLDVVDIEDDSVGEDGPTCWSGTVAGEGDYTCRRHVLRSAVKSDGPYWSGPPGLYLPSGTPVVYSAAPDAVYPRFADWGGEDAEDRPTYGVTFDEDFRRAVSQNWAVEYEMPIPWAGGTGGNVEPGAVISDRAMPFCARGVLGAGNGYGGDRLVILDGPDPLEGTTPDCTAYGPAGSSATLEYRIVEAWQDRLGIESVDGGPPLPTEECFPYAVNYEVRPAGQWLVMGSSTSFLHHVIADADGRCVDDPDPAGCAATPTPFRCLHTSRVTEGVAYRNPWIGFTMNAGTAPTPRGLRYELGARGGFDALVESVGTLPVAVTLDLSGRTGPAALAVDAATDGLVRVGLDRTFAMTDTWE